MIFEISSMRKNVGRSFIESIEFHFYYWNVTFQQKQSDKYDESLKY